MTDSGVDRSAERLRLVIFFAVFAVLYAYYLAVTLFSMTGQSGISATILEATATYGPSITANFAIPAEVVPALLGAALAWAAPGRTSWARLVLLLIVTATGYAMYLHLGAQLDGGERSALQEAMLSENTTEAELPKVLTTLSSYAGSLRGFSATVLGALVGFRFNAAAAVVAGANT